MTGVKQTRTSCLFVHIDMFDGVLFFPVLRKNPAREAASKTFAHDTTTITTTATITATAGQ